MMCTDQHSMNYTSTEPSAFFQVRMGRVMLLETFNGHFFVMHTCGQTLICAVAQHRYIVSCILLFYIFLLYAAISLDG